MVVPRLLALAVLGLTLAGCQGEATIDASSDELAPLATCVDMTRCGPRAGDGDLLLSDRDSDRVLRFDSASGALLSTPLPGEQPLTRPSSARVHHDGLLYVAHFDSSTIYRYDGVTGEPVSLFYRDTWWLEEPVELHFVDDLLYVLGNDSRNIVVLEEREGAGRLLGELAAARLVDPHDFLFLPSGLVLVAAMRGPARGGALQLWDLERDELLESFGDEDELGAATGLALGTDGLLYVADHQRDQIVRYELDTRSKLDTIVADDPQLTAPIDLELGRSGALYVLCDEGVLLLTGLQRHAGPMALSVTTLVAAEEHALARPRTLNLIPP